MPLAFASAISCDEGAAVTESFAALFAAGETPEPLTKTVYEYNINRDETPWKLCLKDRFGQYCMNPQPNDGAGSPVAPQTP